MSCHLKWFVKCCRWIGFVFPMKLRIWIWSLIWQTLTKWSGGSVMGEFRKDSGLKRFPGILTCLE